MTIFCMKAMHATISLNGYKLTSDHENSGMVGFAILCLRRIDRRLRLNIDMDFSVSENGILINSQQMHDYLESCVVITNF